jgi:hypothetical protein
MELNCRKNTEPGRAEDLVVTQDFVRKRLREDAYRICKRCSPPPSSDASYVISCAEHNQPQ